MAFLLNFMRIFFALTLICSLLCLDTNAQGIDSDSLNRLKPLGDTTSVFYRYIQDDLSGNVSPYSSNYFEQINLHFFGLNFRNQNLGNTGSPVYATEFEMQEKQGIRIGRSTLDPYRITASKLKRFYLSRNQIPYTELNYSQLNFQNIFLNAQFAHQITPSFYYSIYYDISNFDGFFQGQKNRHQNFAFHAEWNHKKYSNRTVFTHNSMNHFENGGILNDSLSGTNLEFLNTLDVRLNIQKDVGPAHLNKHYNLSNTSDFKLNANINLALCIDYTQDEYKFFDKNPGSDTSFYTFFLTNQRGLRNYLKYSNLNLKPKLVFKNKNLTAILEAGYQYHVIDYEIEDYYFNNFFVQAQGNYKKDSSLTIFWKGRIQNSRTGWDYNSSAQLNANLSPWFGLQFYASFQSFEPSELTNRIYVSQEKLWENNFKSQKELSGFLSISIPRLSLQVKGFGHYLTDYIYFDKIQRPVQSAQPAFILGAVLSHHLKIWKLNWTNELFWQKTLNGNQFLWLPEWQIQSRFTFQSSLFKTVELETGIQFVFTSSFFAPDYNPVAAVFFEQNQMLMSYYPRFDYFVQIKLWQFRFFINAENLSYFIFGQKNYYNLPHYPTANWQLRLGIKWQLFN